MTPEQVNDVLRVSAGTRDYVIFRLGFLLGLRPGELRALKWHHIDFKRGELTVLEYARVTGDGDTKTVDSRRTLQFDEETGVALLAHKAMQEAEAEQAVPPGSTPGATSSAVRTGRSSTGTGSAGA